MLEKECRVCHETKPLEAGFYKQSRNRDGYHHHCKKCADAATLAWRKAHPEKWKVIVARWQKSHPEKLAANSARYYARKAQRDATTLPQVQPAD